MKSKVTGPVVFGFWVLWDAFAHLFLSAFDPVGDDQTQTQKYLFKALRVAVVTILVSLVFKFFVFGQAAH